MRAYYGSRFSPNMTTTPEGFLICHNVPIARTGWYEYLGEEIGVPEMAGKIVQVYRSPEVVFSPAAMASFEGKVLTDEHPPEEVTPDNARVYMRGVTQNVRQGTGEKEDLLLADLVAYDQSLIDEIRDGKREVSCGYECVYAPRGDGMYEQQQIVGNHVAVVKNGRAGDRVAIKDSKTDQKKGEMKKMSLAKKIADALPRKKPMGSFTNALAAVGLKIFAVDAEPEQIMDAVEALAEEKKAADEEEAKQQPPTTGKKDDEEQTNDENIADPAVTALEAKVDKLTELVTQFVQGGGQKDGAPEDPIDAAIAELEGQTATGDNDEEESHTIPAGAMDDEDPVTDPEDRPQSAVDVAFKIKALKAMKPVLAQIKDPGERKRAADAAIKAIKGKPSTNTYAAVAKGQKQAATDKQNGASKTQDHSQLGRDIAKQFNPHYKDRA